MPGLAGAIAAREYYMSSTEQAPEPTMDEILASIRKIIADDEESPADIFSDDRIVEILNKDGIDIARRTVAKYREAMKIPSSVQRRREKNKAL